jgi:hypothetical protein
MDPFFAFPIIALGFVIGGMVLWIWTLVDVIRMPGDRAFKTGTQLVWVLVIVLAGWIGSLIYLIVGRPPGGATAARARMNGDEPVAPPPPPGTIG